MPLRQPRRAGLLLKTGQTTQYSSELDDGYYEKGLTKRYGVLTTGQYSGTSNIDLVHFQDTDVSFTAATKTISSTGTDLSTLFNNGDDIVISGSTSNDGVYSSITISGTDIVTSEALTDEAAGATVSIAKREALSNNCVLDRNTGLMWVRYTSAENAAMGASSNGKMPWTGKLYDIFQWCAAANSASLGGYSDWRVPNDLELKVLMDMEVPNALPDATAFPGWSTADYYWSATTRPSNTSAAMILYFYHGDVSSVSKSNSYYVALVRG